MRTKTNRLVVAVLSAGSVLAVTASACTPAAVALAATTALFLGGAGLGNPGPGFKAPMTDNFVDPFFATDIPAQDQVTVAYPAQHFPIGWMSVDASVAAGQTALQQAIVDHAGGPIIVVGHSQGTRVETVTKRAIIAAATLAGNDFEDYPDIDFVLVSNVNKPNGGIAQRFTFAAIPSGFTLDGSTPTNSPQNPNDASDYALNTKDFSFVHDLFSDASVYPLANPLAVVNAIAGIPLLHIAYWKLTDVSPDSPDVFYQGSYGDTEYYMIRTDIVPLISWLQYAGVPRPLLLFADEPLRVLIETAYERDTNPGEPMAFRLIPRKNPLTVAWNFLQAFPVGIDDASEELGLGRPLGTKKSGPFGVGGPVGPIAEPTATPPITNDAGSPSIASAPIPLDLPRAVKQAESSADAPSVAEPHTADDARAGSSDPQPTEQPSRADRLDTRAAATGPRGEPDSAIGGPTESDAADPGHHQPAAHGLPRSDAGRLDGTRSDGPTRDPVSDDHRGRDSSSADQRLNGESPPQDPSGE